ncbi:MAG: hypothetical protein OIN88_12390 [Candidatus Methanoperedens sp.]|nr:hypothetical protein [Candidatus Methanoperedens sp.]MCZ7360709.1 hypothetical protein [Candidatus Methanoperedens sp.]HLB71585.1 hypothetical protein [Candidatus Methanoperedens sp.]
MKNITPIEAGNTICGALPEITSDVDETAKEVMKSNTSAVGLPPVFKVKRDLSMLISAYFSMERLYVDIEISRINQK